MNAKAAAAYLGLPSVNARNRGAPNGKAGNTKGPQSRASHADRGAGI